MRELAIPALHRLIKEAKGRREVLAALPKEPGWFARNKWLASLGGAVGGGLAAYGIRESSGSSLRPGRAEMLGAGLGFSLPQILASVQLDDYAKQLTNAVNSGQISLTDLTADQRKWLEPSFSMFIV